MADPQIRLAARVLLLNPDNRLLLTSCRAPETGKTFWITPGGGLDPGETHEQAAIRELYEETGLQGVTLGPEVWQRRHVFPWLGRLYDQRERFFLCRIDHTPEVRLHAPTEDELLTLEESRWWSLSEIRSANDTAFAPWSLADRLEPLLSGVLPDEPLVFQDG